MSDWVESLDVERFEMWVSIRCALSSVSAPGRQWDVPVTGVMAVMRYRKNSPSFQRSVP